LNVSGNLGHPLNAGSLCGWLLTTAVGQRIGLLGEVSLIRIVVHYVIRRRRTFNICS